MRAKAIKLVGLPEPRFRELEAQRAFTTELDARGRKRFNPNDLARQRLKYEREVVRSFSSRAASITGERAARIFTLFREKVELRQIVIDTETTPEQVAELRRQYASLGDDLLVSSAGVKELREILAWEGTDEASLLRAVYVRLRYQFDRGRQVADEETQPTKGSNDAAHARPEVET